MASSDSKNGGFKLPGSSLDEVFKVIQGYATFGKAASLADIAKNTGMHESSISRNVGFLLALGLLEGGRTKAPTELGSRLGLAIMHSIPEEVEAILSDVVSKDEFMRNVLAAVRIRKGMDESALRSHIAYSAGQSKTGSTSTGTGAVVELLKRSGNLKEEDGKLVVQAPIARPQGEGVSQDRVSQPINQQPQKEPLETVETVSHTIEAPSPFSISIKIQVSCEPKDLDDLGVKLRKVVDDFSKSGADDLSEE